MPNKSGGKLRPADFHKKQRREFEDPRVTDVLAAMWRLGLLATKGAFSRVLRWFGNLAKGSMVDYRTPFYAQRVEGKLVYVPQDEVVAKFKPILDDVLRAEGDLGDTLSEWEAEHAAAVGPMSLCKSWFDDGPMKAAAVFADKPKSREVDDRALDLALDEFASFVQPQSVLCSTLSIAIEGSRGDGSDAMDSSTNSGLPYAISPWWYRRETDPANPRTSRGVESVEAFEYVVAECERLLPLLMERELSIDDLPMLEALSGQRLVSKGMIPFSPKSKRLVIAMPKIDAVLGRVALIGLVARLSKVQYNGVSIIPAWSPAWFVDQTMQQMLRMADERGIAVLSGDISNFDATVPPWLLERVGRVIASWVRGGEAYVTNLVHMMLYRTRLWTPSGSFGPGPSSMKSGSWCTSILGSCTNAVIQLYGKHLGVYGLDAMTLLGDDFDLVGLGTTPETTSQVFAHFGMEANPKKQFVKKGYCQFLQRLHTLNRIGGVASANRTLGSILSLEKLAVKPREWNKYAYIVQALSKLQNTAFHPAHAPLIDFVARGDHLQLGRSMAPMDLVKAAGTVATKMLGDQAHQPWKAMGSGVGFADWTSNGVLRGEVLPPAGNALFNRVYGRDPFTTD